MLWGSGGGGSSTVVSKHVGHIQGMYTGKPMSQLIWSYTSSETSDLSALAISICTVAAHDSRLLTLRVRSLLNWNLNIPLITYFRYHLTEICAVIGTHSTVWGDKLLYGHVPDPFPQCWIGSGLARLKLIVYCMWNSLVPKCSTKFELTSAWEWGCKWNTYCISLFA